MLVTGFPAAAFATNCYIVAPGPGQECLIVDPGVRVVDRIAEVLSQHRLRPAAVLLTHGHLDHVYSVTPVCGGHGVAAYIHAADQYRLKNPLDLVDGQLLAMLEQQFGRSASWQEPDDQVQLVDGAELELAGLRVRVAHAPGHTEGSVMFVLPEAPELPGAPAGITEGGEAAGPTVLSGDVLFAGSIGRTDLPGGDHSAMLRSLRDKVLPLPDEALVLPGHGPVTTIGRERRTNPFLRQLPTG